MKYYTYDEICAELPEIKSQYQNGDFNDLIEGIRSNKANPKDFVNSVAKFTIPEGAYFEALIRFIEAQLIKDFL